MVEVFKTNVEDMQFANQLVNCIQSFFKNYDANFDLEDCDKVLRVSSTKGNVHAESVIRLLKFFDCHAEVLQDQCNPDSTFLENAV